MLLLSIEQVLERWIARTARRWSDPDIRYVEVYNRPQRGCTNWGIFCILRTVSIWGSLIASGFFSSLFLSRDKACSHQVSPPSFVSTRLQRRLRKRVRHATTLPPFNQKTPNRADGTICSWQKNAYPAWQRTRGHRTTVAWQVSLVPEHTCTRVWEVPLWHRLTDSHCLYYK